MDYIRCSIIDDELEVTSRPFIIIIAIVHDLIMDLIETVNKSKCWRHIGILIRY